ncbi:WxL domain-containing protein, partial [Enterococcus faecium]|nr:WxL domain-containing protein [Enterococcus faecium]
IKQKGSDLDMKKHVALFSSVLMMSTTLLGAGSVFADDEMQGTTSVSTTLSIPEVPSPVPPIEGGENNNNGNNVTGHFGLAYQPTSFSAIDVLGETGQKEIAIQPKTTNGKGGFHVGVKDTRREKSHWNLSAKLEWNGKNKDAMMGSTIKATNEKVQLNKNGALTDLTNNEVTGTQSLTINSKDSEVMKAEGKQVVNGVYNYELKNVKLVIPNQENVAAGEYTGTVTWNLQETPAAK